MCGVLVLWEHWGVFCHCVYYVHFSCWRRRSVYMVVIEEMVVNASYTLIFHPIASYCYLLLVPTILLKCLLKQAPERAAVGSSEPMCGCCGRRSDSLPGATRQQHT
jgi:hypothetical protein